MRTARAYTAKRNAETLGKTFKVQDTNHRAFTTTLYRGSVGCPPVDYTQLYYPLPCLCTYLQGPPAEIVITRYDGGTPDLTGRILDGGYPLVTGPIVSGGNP
jgi:hypothetical protein